MKFAVRKVVALLLAILMFVPSVASFAEGTVDYSDTVSTYTLDPESLSVEEAIQEVYDEYIAELQAMATYEERYTWLNNAKNNPPSELGDFFYADFIAYYNTNNPDGDLICVCENPVAYGAEGHDAACRWSAESIAADDAITAVYDEYIAELKAMTSYADRYAWLYSAKNEPASDLGDYFYADFIAYYNEKEPTGDAMCVCAEPLVYGADGHTEGCRWNINNLVIVPGASASSGSASVSGELPAGATLSVTSSESAPAAFTGLFETDKGAYTDTQYNSYDLKIMVGDQQWQPGSKVAVTLANVWSGEGTPAVYVYHFIDVASAIDSDCIISYDSDLVSAYPEAAAAAAEAGYANAVAYEVFSTIDGTATYNAETNSVSFSLDSFSYVVTGASSEAQNEAIVEAFETQLDILRALTTYEERYAQIAEWADQDTGMGTELYAQFVEYYKTTYPLGDLMCICVPPYTYGTEDHTDEACGWHAHNIEESTISSGSISVSGYLPANAQLVASSRSVPSDFADYFEITGLDYSNVQLNAYNVEIQVDGEKWQPSSRVYVTLPDAWDTSIKNPSIYVYHFIESEEELANSSDYYISTDEYLTSTFTEARTAATNVLGYTAVAYTVSSSRQGQVNYNSNGSIGFVANSFSAFVVVSGGTVDLTDDNSAIINNGTNHTLKIPAGASVIFPVSTSYTITPSTSDASVATAVYNSSDKTVTVTATQGAAPNSTATITLRWYYNNRSAKITVTIAEPPVTNEGIVTITRNQSVRKGVKGMPNEEGAKVKDHEGKDFAGIKVEPGEDGVSLMVSAGSEVENGTYTVSWTDESSTAYVMSVRVVDEGDEGTVNVTVGGSVSATVKAQPNADGVSVTNTSGNTVEGISVVNNSDGTSVTVSANSTVSKGTYTATYMGTDNISHTMTIIVGMTEEGTAYVAAGSSTTKTVTAVPASDIVIKDSDGNVIPDSSVSVSANSDGTSVTVSAASTAIADEYTVTYKDANGLMHELIVNVTGGYASDNTGEVVQIGYSTLRPMNIAEYDTYIIKDADGNVVTQSSASGLYISEETGGIRISAASDSDLIGSYTVEYGTTTNGYFYKAGEFPLEVVASTVTDGGNYKLLQTNYSGDRYVFWDQFQGTLTQSGASVYDGEEQIESVTLNGIAVDNADSSSTSWSTAVKNKLSNYYGSSVTSSSDIALESLTITPKPGYYVTAVVVGCATASGSGDGGSQTPYKCNTWGSGNAFTASFSLGTSSSVTVQLPSNAFGHGNRSATAYFILIKVAPIPSPLLVEYNYGDIVEILGNSAAATAIFNDADAWTAEAAGNYYGSHEDNAGADTEYTQYRYQYADDLTDAEEAADVNLWTHNANTVTNDAKELAAGIGYYFAGWKATYYTTCDDDKTVDEYGNNWTYDFSGSYGTAMYGENEEVELTTNVQLVAQWKPLELLITKTVDGLTDAYANDSETYTIYLQKQNADGTWSNVSNDPYEITVTGNGTSTAIVYSPVTAGTYRLYEEIDTTGSNADRGEDMFFITFETNGELNYTTQTIMNGIANTGKVLNVTNIYSTMDITNTTPLDSYLTVQKTFTGLSENNIPADFTITLSDSKNIVVATLTMADAVKTADGVYTWTVTGLAAGTYTVTESGETVTNYKVTTTGTGTVATTASNMVITQTGNVPVVDKTEWTISADIIVAKVSATDAYFVWTKDALSANQREVVLAVIGGNATVGNTSFFTGSDLITYRGRTTQYNGTTLTFSYPKQFSTMWYGTYSGITGDNNEINVSNAYEMTVTSFNVTKTVSGNVGDQSKNFKFKITVDGNAYTADLTDANGATVSADDNGYYEFSHGDVLTISNVPIGAVVVVTEYQEGYEAEIDIEYTPLSNVDTTIPEYVVNDKASAIATINGVVPGATITFTNTKNITVDTGILLDSAPYVLLLALVGAGIAFMIIRRRRRED